MLSLTEMGKMATNINEVHCLVMAEMISDNLFDGLDIYQLVSLFSIFCDLRLSDENKIYSVDHVNCDLLVASIKELVWERDELDREVLESSHSIMILILLV